MRERFFPSSLAFPRERGGNAAAGLPGRVGSRGERKRREQTEIDVHRLVRARTGVDGLDVAAGDMGEQRAMCGGRRGRCIALAAPLRSREPAGEQADRRRFHIAFAAGDLAGEAQSRIGAQPQALVEQLWGVEEGIAMQPAEACELGLFQARNGAEDSDLLAVLELGLEADHVEQGAEPVVLAQLDDGVGLGPRPCGLVRPNGFIGPWRRVSRPRSAITSIGRQPSKYGVAASQSWNADLVAGKQGIDEGVILLARERAVDVVGARSARAGLVVARLEPGDRHVDGVAVHDRRDGIEEGERVLAGERARSPRRARAR